MDISNTEVAIPYMFSYLVLCLGLSIESFSNFLGLMRNLITASTNQMCGQRRF